MSSISGISANSQINSFFSSQKNDEEHLCNALEKMNLGSGITHSPVNSFDLFDAVANGDADVVKLLLAKGADPGIKTKNGYSPLHFACACGHFDVASALIEGKANINETDGSNDTTALAIAAYNGLTDVVKLLLAKGADHKIKTKDGCSPLYFACLCGHFDAASALIHAKANINETNGPTDTTALAIAALHGDTDLVKLLLAEGADHRIKTKYGCSPLYLACAWGHFDAASALIDAKANINETNGPDEDTALSIAARKGHTKVVKLLLENGADLALEKASTFSQALLPTYLEHQRNQISKSTTVSQESIQQNFIPFALKVLKDQCVLENHYPQYFKENPHF